MQELSGKLIKDYSPPRAPQMALVVKNSITNSGDTREAGSVPGLYTFPWRKAWQPTPVLLPGESHGQRTRVGYCSKGVEINLKFTRVEHEVVTRPPSSASCHYCFTTHKYTHNNIQQKT